jgi:EmrB/QacA subfamily drug resistance transporter
MSSPIPSEARPRHTKSWIILGGILASFIAALDTTILATVMPTIVTELGGLHLYGWVFSAYMIMTAVSMPLWGKLSDVYGKRIFFFAAVATFLVGSILCGTSSSMIQLIIFRGIQGIGAGGLSSMPFALISTVFSPGERGKALGAIASAWGISAVIGPLLGSAVVVSIGWTWVFYLNIPIGIASILIIASNYREEPGHGGESIDFPGAILLTLTIISLLLALLRMGRVRTPLDEAVLLLLAAWVLFLVLFIRRERSAPHPILEIGFFRRRAFWLGNLLGFLASIAMYGVIAYAPLFAQTILGGTAMQAGLMITPMSLGWSTASLLAGRVAHRWGEPRLVRIGLLLMAVGLFLAYVAGAGIGVWYLMGCVTLIGIGMGCQTPSLMLTVQQSVEHRNIGVATSSQMLSRTIGGAVGVSVLGSALNGVMGSVLGGSLIGGQPVPDPQKLIEPSVRATLSPADQDLVLRAFGDGMQAIFLIALVVALASFTLSFFLLRVGSRPATS